MPVSKSDKIISELKTLVESDRRSQIRLNANGGNAVLVVCDPPTEKGFIDSIYENLDKTKFEIIDLNQLLLEFVNENKQDIETLFDLLQGSVNQIFKAPIGEESDDYFKQIIEAVSACYSISKIPVLINTGSLYGAGIDNIQIMEHEIVMNASQPLILLYPATQDGDSLTFLGQRPASKYRCMIIS